MTKIDSEETLASVVAQVRSSRRGFLKGVLAWSAAFGALLRFTSDALSSNSGQDAPGKEGEDFQANAEITTINKAKGIVTAKLNSSGQLFQFKLVNNTQLEQLKVGQPVFANRGTREVFLDSRNLAGRITNVSAPTKGPAAKSPTAQKVSPSWKQGLITNINDSSGIVTAKDNATGQSFRFRVANAGIVGQLYVGQRIFANFAGRQVSFDGKAALGAITTGPQ